MKGISKRVAIGFFSIVALLFISGMISLFELSNLSTDTEDILSASRRNMEIANDMLKSAHEHSLAVMHIVVFGERSREDVCRRALSDLEGRLAAARNEALDASQLDTLASSIEALRRETDAYLSVDHTKPAPVDSVAVVQIAVEGVMPSDVVEREAAMSGLKWYDTKYRQTYDNLSTQIQEFMTHTHSSLEPRAEQLNKNAYRSVTPVFISLIVMILIVLMFYYFINVYCVKPVVKMDKSLSDYLAYRLPFNVKTELLDEYKDLHDHIETLINLSKQENKQ